MTSLSLLQNSFILRRPRVANLADIIKIAFMFIIAIFKDSKTLKESEIMYYNASYICSFWYNKSCWFSVKKCWYQQNLTVVSRNWYIFWIFFMQGITVLSVIIVGYVWQLLWKVRFFAPPPVSIREQSGKGPSWRGLKDTRNFQTLQCYYFLYPF